MQKTAMALLTVPTLMVLAACELIHEKEGKKFAEEVVSKCNGEVISFTLVTAPEGKNLYEGLARVKIEEDIYDLSIELKTGANGAIGSTGDDPCSEHKVKKGIQSLVDIFTQ